MSSLLHNCLLLVRGKLLQGVINMIKDIWVDVSAATEWNIWQPFSQHGSCPGTGKPGASKHYCLFSILYSRQHLTSAHIIRCTFIQSHKLSSVHHYQRERERECVQNSNAAPAGDWFWGKRDAEHKDVMQRKKNVIQPGLSHKPSI